MKKQHSRQLSALALSAAIAATAVFLGTSTAQAADRAIDKIGALEKADYSNAPFVGSLTLPAASGSLNDLGWLASGAVTSDVACPSTAWSTRSFIVHADGSLNPTVISIGNVKSVDIPAPGYGMDGSPVNLTKDAGNYLLGAKGFNQGGAIPEGPFWFARTCSPVAMSGHTFDTTTPYFAVKLMSDGTNWTVATDEEVVAKPTTTTFSHVASRADGRVDFTASVTAEGATVSGGTVDFVNTANDAVLATGTVVAGQAQATSTTPINPIEGVSVSAVYRGTAAFATSPSAAQTVFGVQPASQGTSEGDVSVVVEEREEPAPAGSVKFTAAATSVLGKAAFTAKGIEANGAIDGAVVTDSRSNKSAAWVVNGRASDFTTVATPVTGKLNTIPASALSWKPAKKAGTQLPAGATEGAADQKLNADRALVSWAAGGTGPAETVSQVGASLKLAADGDFVPGSYTAKLTLTLI